MRKILKFFLLILLSSATKISPKFTARSVFKSSKQLGNNSTTNFRLPNNTLPLHYDIDISTHVHDKKFEFEGHVTVNFAVKSPPLNKITIHVRQLKNIKIKLFDTSRRLIENDLMFDLDKVKDFLTIKPLNDLIINQNYYIMIDYSGKLRDDNLGFYKSSYYNEQNKTIWLAATQFQSIEARSAFPCWDEPQIRAPFKIKITHGKNYRAISNMPERYPIIPSAIPGYVTTEFQESFPMQTYLVAFIVSDFKDIADDTKAITHRVFSRPQSIDAGEADLALKYGQEILSKLSSHLGVAYFRGLLSKMDQLGLPDFAMGAMENYGLVTYSEEYLLYNDLIGTAIQRENILIAISHEFVHMYFGDLIAPQWWNYLWLNEGFATLYQHYLPSLIYEADRLMDSFIIQIVQPALEFDGHSSRSMNFYVEDPDNIDGLYDSISYQKAGSVLRMMQNAIGDETWRKGLKYYLNDMSFKVASPQDLHVNLQRAMNEDDLNPHDIAEIMLSWETQPGYPLITVNKTKEKLTFTQKRFWFNHPMDSSPNNAWHVPINYITASDSVITSTKPDMWMSQQKIIISRRNAPKYWRDDDWIIVNLQQGYYYRVNYDNDLWMSLTAQLYNCHDKVDLKNRAQLIDDSFSLARAGLIPYDIPLGILKYLKYEIDYVPWQSAYKNMLLLNRLLSGLSVHKKYQKFIRNLVEPFYNKIGFETIKNEHKFKSYSRTIAYNLACIFGHEQCIRQVRSKVIEKVSVHPDMQEAIFINGLREIKSKDVYEAFIEKMLNSRNQAERTLLIRALANTQEEELLNSFLTLTITDDSRLRLQEKNRIWSVLPYAGEKGAKVAMEFIRENHDELDEISSNLIKSILNNIAPLISSYDSIRQFNQLLDFLISEEVIKSSLKSSLLEIVNSTKKWQDKYAKHIERWIDANGSTTSTMVSMVVLMFSLSITIFV